MTELSLSQRLGIASGELIDNDFPTSARSALICLFEILDQKGYLISQSEILLELRRIGRIAKSNVDESEGLNFQNQLTKYITNLKWFQVINFCERVYSRLLQGTYPDFDGNFKNITEVRDFFVSEINVILDEENLAFQFSGGTFHRRGKAQTQKSIKIVGQVLSNPRLNKVRTHYIKARNFFDKRPEIDSENCVKEALCALEAAIEILTGKNGSKEFDTSIRKLLGNTSNKIPIPIGESMIKIHAYRGSGQGVAHAATLGNRVEPVDAELIMSLVASYITYLVDVFPFDEEIPF